jgi:hypothetical protein
MKIKAQGDQKVEKVTVGFPEEVYRHVVLYRDLLGGRTRLNYVVVEAVRFFLRADKEFQAYLDKHGQGGAETVAKTPRPRVAEKHATAPPETAR